MSTKFRLMKSSCVQSVFNKSILQRSLTSILDTQVLRHVSTAKPYNTVLEKEKREEYVRRKTEHIIQKKHDKDSNILDDDSLAVSLRYLGKPGYSGKPAIQEAGVQHFDEFQDNTTGQPQFPYSYKMGICDVEPNLIDDSPVDTYRAIDLRNKASKETRDWMLSYDNFDDTHQSEMVIRKDVNYGTPDPNSTISNVPCGGCGALLHCKDPSLPGYLPSEIYKNSWSDGGAHLNALICQRCYFLKHLNIALEVQVSADDYPRVLQTIGSKKNAVVVLMVDLTDFPCSIWPGIADIFYGKPIIVVGNKVDLLPKDGSNYLNSIRTKLMETIKSHGFGCTRIIDVVLTSATTGYGVENLITVLHKSWKYKGNVYLVGCTNVGKSSLFNALIRSDYCKSQAEDLIQRATTSVWPGTTLNLLKFPIAKPSGHKLELRKRRLAELKKLEKHEMQIRNDLLTKTNDSNYAVLMGRIDRSFKRPDQDEPVDSFSLSPSSNATGQVKLGVNEKDPLYALSRWCFDTPGVIQRDHILHLLTTEELYLTLPKTIITPRTYCVQPGESIFIAGLTKLDYTKGEQSARFTVFSSNELPISICKIEESEEFYRKYLGSGYLKVPFGGDERIRRWPGLKESKSFTVNGIDPQFSSKDVVLSNAGWISVTGKANQSLELKAWTPEGRGVHLRDCLLPQAVNMRGPRIKFSPAYKAHKYSVNNRT